MVALILAGASCSEQKQSEFNFDSVKQEATISAKITYDAGVEIDSTNPNGYKIANAKPAVGKKVFIEIPFAQYSGAAGVQGNQIFETVTDENGVFTITVPTKSTGVNGTLRLEEFTALHREYVKMENGKPVFKTKMYSYDTPAALGNINIKPGAFKFPDNNDISYTMHALDIEDFDENVTIAGSINLAYETGFREGAFKSASNANVEFEIAYVGMANPLTFGTTTDANGNYKIVLPMRSLSQGFTINSIKVLGIGDNAFKHWISDTIAEPEIVKGAYELAGITAGAPIGFANVIDGITYDLGAKNLIFTPYYNANITNIPAPENWTTDLIGWSAGRADLGFDETYNKTVTLTGKVHIPYLKEYGVGDFKSVRQTIILTGDAAPYDNGLVIITDENGAFSVDLPVVDDQPINFDNIKLEKLDQPFEFKGSKKNVTLYDGKYSEDGGIIGKVAPGYPGLPDVVQIKAEGTEWYDLGDFYFKYAPAAGNTPDEWNDDLIGWYRDPDFNKINSEKPIKGTFKFAIETSFGKGGYEAKPYIVTIGIDDDKDGNDDRSIAVKPDGNGNIEFYLPVKDELDQPKISVTTANFPTKEYIHYTEYGKDNTRLLEANYTLYKTVYEEKDPEWNEEIGTRYYKFAQASTPGTTPGIPSTFHKNLADWLILTTADDLQYNETAIASGKALQTIETGFLAGKLDKLAGEIIKATIDGVSVEVLTAPDGKFQFNVPLKYVGEKPALDVATAAVDAITIDKFTHYDLKETMIISGKLTPEKVKEDNAEWNDLGTVYYVFTPDNKATIWDGWDTYTKYIAGWAYKKGYTNPIAVTGSAMIAKETEFRKGEYEAAKNFPVLLTATNSGLNYAAATDAEGNFSINVLEEYADDDDVIAWDDTPANLKKLDIKFEHFRKGGSSTTKDLAGGYQYKDNVNASTKWNEKGTNYYKFVPDAEPATWTQDLAGWVVWDKDAKTTLTITGSIKKAAEVFKSSGPANETWAAAAFATADVTITGIGGPYKICTNGSGSFTFQVKVKEQVDTYTITVAPDDIDETVFNHWADPASNVKTYAPGKYKKVVAPATVNTKDITKTGTSTKYEFKPSAKMYFDPTDPLLTGWGSYDWTGKYDDED